MKLLALDTSTEACSVALLVDEAVFHRFELAGRTHTKKLLPMIDAVLREGGLATRELDAIAFGAGPGSFTGIRIATSTAQGMALAFELPVIPVSTLETLAIGGFRLHGTKDLIPALDARRGQIYWGRYRIENGLTETVVQDKVTDLEHLPIDVTDRSAIIGTGVQSYAEQLRERIQNDEVLRQEPRYPNALDMLTLAKQKFLEGKTVSADEANAIYFRRGV